MRILLYVGLALGLAGLTHQQTARWQSERSLWCDAVRLAPDKPRPLNNCALALLHEGHADGALPLLDRALQTLEVREPNRRSALRATVQTNRFLALMGVRRPTEAFQALEGLDPTDPRVVRFQAWPRE